MEIEIKCTYDELVPLGDLKRNEKNRNKHRPEQIARLAKLYRELGVRHPIIVSRRSGLIVAGHGRDEAAWLCGMTHFPVDYQDFASDEEEYAFATSDNAIGKWTYLDLAGINFDLPELGPDFDIELLGLEDFTLDVAEKGELDLDKAKKTRRYRCPACEYEWDAKQK